MTASLQGSWFDRGYDKRAALDGPVIDESLGAGYQLAPTLRAEPAAGWSRERPKRKNQRHEGCRVQAGFTAVLPRGFTVGGSAALRWNMYEGSWFPFTESGKPREDLTHVFRLSFHHRAFTRGASARGFLWCATVASPTPS